jgi:AAA ATPase-like protein
MSSTQSAGRFNPFRPGRIAGPGMFAGRGEELIALERILTQTIGGNAQHFLLSGERGIGKSSLLLFLKLIAKKEITSDFILPFAVVEIELEQTCTYPQLIKQIAAGLRRAVAPFDKTKERLRSLWDVVKNIEGGGFKYSTEDRENHELFDDLVTAFVSAGQSLRGEIGGILVLIDEADKAPLDAQLGGFCKVFTERLTKEGCDNVCLGLAGVTGVLHRLRSSHESAPRIFTIFGLKPLEARERHEVVTRGLDHANSLSATKTTIQPDALQAIATLSEGFPHFIQQFAYCAFEQDKDGIIDLDDVSLGALGENGALDQLGEKYFQQMYFEKISSNEYRAVLQTMAQSKDRDGWTTKEEIRQATGLRETTLGNAIHTLKDKEIIAAKLGEKGVYRLPTQSFAAWIRARHLTSQLTADPSAN